MFFIGIPISSFNTYCRHFAAELKMLCGYIILGTYLKYIMFDYVCIGIYRHIIVDLYIYIGRIQIVP